MNDSLLLSFCRVACIVIFCLAYAVADEAKQPLGDFVPDASLISNEYSRISDILCKDLREKVDSKSTNAVPVIKTVGYLRIRNATSVLIENLGYPARHLHHNGFSEINTNYKLFIGGVTTSGEDRLLEWAFPSVGAVERIGVTLSEVTNSLPNYPRSYQRNCVFTQIGWRCAGGYFNKYIDSLFAGGDDSYKPLLKQMISERPVSTHIMFLDARHGYTNYNIEVCNCYDAMQDKLISMFKSQLASGDVEIADTIYTMGFIRSDRAMPLLIDNLTICPQVSTNAPSGFVFPAAEALISIWPPLGICFDKLESSAPMSLEESLWLRITHEVYPEAIEYDLMKKSEKGDPRAARQLRALPWRRLED